MTIEDIRDLREYNFRFQTRPQIPVSLLSIKKQLPKMKDFRPCMITIDMIMNN